MRLRPNLRALGPGHMAKLCGACSWHVVGAAGLCHHWGWVASFLGWNVSFGGGILPYGENELFCRRCLWRESH